MKHPLTAKGRCRTAPRTPINPDFNIFLFPVRKTGEYLYIIKYKVIPVLHPETTEIDPDIKITRVEIRAHGTILAEEIVGNLNSGKILVNLNQEGFVHLQNTALALQGFAWDQYFNCRAGNESFIYVS